MILTAKLFRNGGSQAVRLPKQFAFDGDEVCIRQIGSAVLIFKKGDEWKLMKSAIGQADEDFLPDRAQPKKSQRRKRL